jgi:hypothetical protein
MSNNHDNPAFKKLLQKLQEESWQLELIISGFAIFGLFSALEPIRIWIREAQNNQETFTGITLTVVSVSMAILLFNLLLHVILRGLWIGALGLRYVSGDIDYDELKYSPKFTNYLRKKIGSFDKYIATLENYCSVIFAISFLLIFYVLAITFTITAIALTANYIIDNDNLPNWASNGVGIPLVFIIVIGMILTFIDFVTQGFFKKKQWLSKIYFPIYWIFSFITLSFLYRPLVYNFLDNKFGRRLSFILVPVYILILLLTSLKYERSNYIKSSDYSNSTYASKKNYEDMLSKEGQFIKTVAIPSKVIKDSYLKVFMVFSDGIEDRIFSRNEELKPEKDLRGLTSDIQFSNSRLSFRKKDSLKSQYLKTFNKIYWVVIDSTKYTSDFILGESNTIETEFGFESYIDIKDLSLGKHILKIQRDSYNKKDTTITNIATIPFWYYNN